MAAKPKKADKKPVKSAPVKANAKADKAGGKAAKGGKGAPAEKDAKRLGLRGAAPWAARHAAKHAEEARKRAEEPPKPGSARATIRTPKGAEDMKAVISELNALTAQIKGMRKNLNKNYYEIGNLLTTVSNKRLFEVKGIATIDSYLEREVDLGKTTGLRLLKIVQYFKKEGAVELGLDRIMQAIMAIEGSDPNLLKTGEGKVPPPPVSSPMLPMRPPGRL